MNFRGEFARGAEITIFRVEFCEELRNNDFRVEFCESSETMIL